MFASGKTAEVWPQRPSPNTFHRSLVRQDRQGIKEGQQSKDMIPLNAYTKSNGRCFNTEKQANFCDRRTHSIHRLNSAPELHRPELPPIHQAKASVGKPSRPLTPLVLNSHGRTSSSRSLPKNYRINLDLIPLVEVGTWGVNMPTERKRQTSLGSSDSYLSSGSQRLQSLSSSPRPELALTDHEDSFESFPKNATGVDLMADPEDEVESSLEEIGKDKMILRWLQTVEKPNETTTGELLPSIKEGKLS